MLAQLSWLPRLLAVGLFSGAASAGIIPPDKIDAIKKCVAQKMSTSFVWRTHTWYLEAGQGSYSHQNFTFDTCHVTDSSDKDGDAVVNGDGNHSPQAQDDVEGQILQADGTYKPLDNCDRYKFIGPETFYKDGIEKFDVNGSISNEKTLTCNIWTGGSSNAGGGGGHIWGICFAHVAPIYTDADKAAFLKICARQIL
jgi:hypothetical protein